MPANSHGQTRTVRWRGRATVFASTRLVKSSGTAARSSWANRRSTSSMSSWGWDMVLLDLAHARAQVLAEKGLGAVEADARGAFVAVEYLADLGERAVGSVA